MFDISRRNLLGGAMGAAAMLALPRFALSASSAPVVVGTWGGDYGDLLRQSVDVLLQPQGVDVIQSIGSPTERRTKILAERQSRRGSMDVCCLADFDMQAVAQRNAMEKIDVSTVPNLANVLPFLKQDFSVPHIYSAHVIVYNTDKIKVPPQSFADLWDPKYRGKIGLSDFLFNTNMAIAALVGGGSMSDFGPAKGKLEELRALDVKILPSTEAIAAALKSEDIWITVISLARGYMWRKAGIPLAHVVPKEGGFPNIYGIGVPKNSSNKDNALKYLNAVLDPRAQLAFAERMGYVPTVSNTVLPEALNKQINFSDAERDRMMKPDYSYIIENQSAMLEVWNKTFKG
ncbi:extracellular solute-binding protein [Pseudomonas yamanorum]|uniref:extracellular solute-binding protein n=1 Tax=Pseudomonas yamanorum TaxID=515393 RepID=UPI001C44E2C5|nr:extracellular solute-binding protein [Pseudomonas yamanorum]MBV6659696.1 extracellular solute-binding protein [Pseudomonas yamanorum]